MTSAASLPATLPAPAGRSARPRSAPNAGGSARPKLRAVPDADVVEALRRAEDALESALGRGVKVRAVGKGAAMKAELRFDDIDELLAYADDQAD